MTKEVAEIRTIVFSAVRVCKDSGHTVLSSADQPHAQADEKVSDGDQGTSDRSADRRCHCI